MSGLSTPFHYGPGDLGRAASELPGPPPNSFLSSSEPASRMRAYWSARRRQDDPQRARGGKKNRFKTKAV